MKLKRIVSAILAAVMTLGSINAAYAQEAENKDIYISKTVSVSSGSVVDNVDLTYVPDCNVKLGDYITVELKNGTFDKDIAEKGKWISPSGHDWDYMINQYNSFKKEDGSISNASLKTILSAELWNNIFDELPYKIEYIGPTSIKVELFPIFESFCNNRGYISVNIAHYKIPILCTAGNENVILSTSSGLYYADGYNVTVARVDNKPVTVSGYVRSDDCIGIDRLKTVKQGESITDTYIKFTPYDTIKMSDKISITLENGTFDKDIAEKGKWISPSGHDWDYMINQYNSFKKEDGSISNASLKTILSAELWNNTFDELPYKIEYVNDKKINVELFAIAETFCNSRRQISVNVPYYYIPVNAVAGEGNVYINVESDNNVNAPSGYRSVLALSENSSPKDENITGKAVKQNTIASVSAGDYVNNIYLKYTPTFGVEKGDVVYIDIENGTFDKDIAEKRKWKSPSGHDWDYMTDQYDMFANPDGSISNMGLKTILSAELQNNTFDELPYKIEYVSPTRIKVELFPLSKAFCNNSGQISVRSPYYRIPMLCTAGSDNVIVSTSTEIAEAIYTGTIASVDNKPVTEQGRTGGIISVEGASKLDKGGTFNTYVDFMPEDDINRYDTLNISIDNGRFVESAIEQWSSGEYTYQSVQEEYDSNKNEDGSVSVKNIADILMKVLGTEHNELPYKINFVNEKQISVELFPIPSVFANSSGWVSNGRPYYHIPINALADMDDVTINITSKNINAPAQYTAQVAYVKTTKLDVEGGSIYIDRESGEVVDCDESVTSAEIPDAVNGVGVTGISSTAFSGCKELKSVTIPETVTSIAENAFADCVSLTEIYCTKGSSADNKALYPENTEIKYVEAFVYGDADGNNKLEASDAAAVLQKVLKSTYKLPLEDLTPDYEKYLDVDGNGKLEAADAAMILQKVLKSTYVMNVEK